MAERHDAERSVAQARARLTRLTEELSRRASGDYVKAQARIKAGELKARAGVAARERTVVMKDRVMQNPWILGLVGGAVGAAAGRMLGAKARDRYGGREEIRPYDEYTATHEPEAETIITDDELYGLDRGEHGDRMAEIRDSAREAGEGIKHKAGELKEKAGDLGHKAQAKARQVREHIPSGAQVRAKAGRVTHGVKERLPSRGELRQGARRVGGTVEHRPELWGLGALAAGALVAALMPETRRERDLLHPVKEKAGQRLTAAKDEAVTRAQHLKETVTEELRSANEGEGEEERPGPDGRFYAEGEAAEPGMSMAAHDTGAAETTGVGYGATGEEARTYSAGGTSEEEPGFHEVPEPDVTRH